MSGRRQRYTQHTWILDTGRQNLIFHRYGEAGRWDEQLHRRPMWTACGRPIPESAFTTTHLPQGIAIKIARPCKVCYP